MSSINVFPREIFKSIRGRAGDRMPTKAVKPVKKAAVKKVAAKKPAAKASAKPVTKVAVKKVAAKKPAAKVAKKK